MHRFAFFVDGSNLYGSLRAMNVDVSDYQKFYALLYREALRVWRCATMEDPAAPALLQRVYWYVIGGIDEWNLAAPQSRQTLRTAFGHDQEARTLWMKRVGEEQPGLSGPALEEAAWRACFADFGDWYAGRKRAVESMRRFYAGVRASADLVDIREVGHWKVNFLHRWVEEKGLDTALAVDMVALQENYDVAVVVSGDADAIPSIHHLKERGKHIGAVEFVSGGAPDARGRNFSTRLRSQADFVLRIPEQALRQLESHGRVQQD